MAKRTQKTKPVAVAKTRAELAKALGRSVRTVAGYLAEGMPGQAGAYDVAACQAWITESKRPLATEGQSAGLQEKLRQAELENKLEDRRRKKFKNDQLERQLYHADDVERNAAALVARIRLRLEQLPDEVAQCVAAKERRAIRERVVQVIDGMLLEMSNWNPTADETP